MTPLTTDEIYMQRCLQLAQTAIGHTYPNPMVGSVVVHNGVIIGEGYHCKAGLPHAEVNAINSVKDVSLLPQSTLYVNLEPCAHFGRTPPCSLLIIQKKIKRVVIGCVDTFSEVAGKGIKMLTDNGIDVTTGVLERDSRYLNRRFFTFHEKKRPFVILKWAQTADGYIDIERTTEKMGQPTWITNNYARRAVHQMRAHEQAILVGTNTAKNDNPTLNVRDWAGAQPLRIVIDRHCQLPSSLNLFNPQYPTLVVTESSQSPFPNASYFRTKFRDSLPQQILQHLHNNTIQSVIIEGGRQLLQSFIDLDLWDEAFVYKGHVMFGKGIMAPKIYGEANLLGSFGNSELFVYSNNSKLHSTN